MVRKTSLLVAVLLLVFMFLAMAVAIEAFGSPARYDPYDPEADKIENLIIEIMKCVSRGDVEALEEYIYPGSTAEKMVREIAAAAQEYGEEEDFMGLRGERIGWIIPEDVFVNGDTAFVVGGWGIVITKDWKGNIENVEVERICERFERAVFIFVKRPNSDKWLLKEAGMVSVWEIYTEDF